MGSTGSSSGGGGPSRLWTLSSSRFLSASFSACMSSASGAQDSNPYAGRSWFRSTLTVCVPS